MHPTNRAERRCERDRVIARRRYIWSVIWGKSSPSRINEFNNALYSVYAGWTPDWGRYAKWNLGCGCRGCHMEKYLDCKTKRRLARNRSESISEGRTGDRKIPDRMRKNSCTEVDYLGYYQEVEFLAPSTGD